MYTKFENAQNSKKIVRFCVLSTSCAFLVIDYDYVVLKSFNFDSIDVETVFVLSAVWQLAAFNDNLSKHYPGE